MSSTPPVIFSRARRLAARRRAAALRLRGDAPAYLLDDMAEDVIERLGFLRFSPRSALVIGDWTGALTAALQAQGVTVETADACTGLDEEAPYPGEGRDLIVSLASLDTLNDVPGALIHLRQALNPGGLMIASFVGAGSLPALREAMLAADGERAYPRLHPMIDVRAGGQLLQRSGLADPVADSRALNVRFRSLDRLVGDLRAMGLGNVLACPNPPLGRAALERARSAFATGTLERFEIVTLSGWRR